MKKSSILCMFVSLVAASADVSVAQEKTPAEIHVQHVMTSINGTPDGVGLITALRQEAEVAAQHAGLAIGDLTDLESIQKHIKHVRHAVDPSIETKGPGKGFGVQRAAEGVQTHIRLATRAHGATDHIKSHAQHVATSAGNVVTWAKAIMAESEKVSAAESADKAAEPAQKIEALTRQILDGVDDDEDGRISWEAGEGGIAQAEQHLKLLAAGGANPSP